MARRPHVRRALALLLARSIRALRAARSVQRGPGRTVRAGVPARKRRRPAQPQQHAMPPAPAEGGAGDGIAAETLFGCSAPRRTAHFEPRSAGLSAMRAGAGGRAGAGRSRGGPLRHAAPPAPRPPAATTATATTTGTEAAFRTERSSRGPEEEGEGHKPAPRLQWWDT